MRRRAFLGVAATALASGCFGASRYLSEAGGSVVLDNGTEESVSVHIRLVDDESTSVALDETYDLSPEGHREVEDAFGGGGYDAEVSVNDGELTGSSHVSVGRCSAIEFHVDIEPGSLTFRQGYCD